MSKKTNIILGGIFVLLIVALIGARMMLPSYVTDYVNRSINKMDGYSGSISDVDINLYRGAYKIYDLNMFKNVNDIPVPFIAIRMLDLSIEWRALFKGAIVAEIHAYKPVLNFAVGQSSDTVQTGKEANWQSLVNDLMPLDINMLRITKGKIAYQDFSKKPQVNIFINNVDLTATNLRNVDDKNMALPSQIKISGSSIGDGRLKLTGRINVLKDFPDFDVDGQLVDVSLPAINSYSKAFAAVDFEDGQLSLYSELAVRNGQLTGYIKPVAKDIAIIGIKNDSNPINLVWETVVSLVVQVFKNQPHNQLATKIIIEGDVSKPDVNMWATVGGILRNAFIRAFAESTDGTVDFSGAAKNNKK